MHVRNTIFGPLCQKCITLIIWSGKSDVNFNLNFNTSGCIKLGFPSGVLEPNHRRLAHGLICVEYLLEAFTLIILQSLKYLIHIPKKSLISLLQHSLWPTFGIPSISSNGSPDIRGFAYFFSGICFPCVSFYYVSSTCFLVFSLQESKKKKRSSSMFSCNNSLISF